MSFSRLVLFMKTPQGKKRSSYVVCVSILIFLLTRTRNVARGEVNNGNIRSVKTSGQTSFARIAYCCFAEEGSRRQDISTDFSARRSNMMVSNTSSEEEKSSKWYRKKRSYPLNNGCVSQHDWQETSFPTCNTVHETDLTQVHENNVGLINNGGWSDIWLVRDFDGAKQVLKVRTLCSEVEEFAAIYSINNCIKFISVLIFCSVSPTRLNVTNMTSPIGISTGTGKHNTPQTFPMFFRLSITVWPTVVCFYHAHIHLSQHRKDGLVMERLTSYPGVVNIFGFCSVTHLVEYSDGGDIGDIVKEGRIPNSLEMLRIAAQVAASIAHLHNVDREGTASIASTDITPYQFLLIDGIFKLNDFNRGRFIGWNTINDEACPFYVAKNPGKVCSSQRERCLIDYQTFSNQLQFFVFTGISILVASPRGV